MYYRKPQIKTWAKRHQSLVLILRWKSLRRNLKYDIHIFQRAQK